MKEELTNEMLEVMKKCSFNCTLCDANGVCDKYDWQDTIQTLATALLEERAKPKDDVWENAPDNAGHAWIAYYETGFEETPIKSLGFVRQLPKTRARQIAENIVHGINGKTHSETKDIEYVEGVLKRYAEELEGKE